MLFVVYLPIVLALPNRTVKYFGVRTY